MVVNSPCWVLRDGEQALRATIIRQRASEFYVHYDGRDKRLDEWVPANTVQLIQDTTTQTQDLDTDASRAKKRNRITGPSLAHSDGTPAADDESHSPHPSALGPSLHTRDQTEAAQQHSTLTAQRNFERVAFGQWSIKTWYFSPYPSFDDEADAQTRPRATSEGLAGGMGPGGTHSHSSAQASLLTAGATPANHTSATAGGTVSGDATLFVCDRCFKYMREATHWELHKVCIYVPMFIILRVAPTYVRICLVLFALGVRPCPDPKACIPYMFHMARVRLVTSHGFTRSGSTVTQAD